jgi:hypothetical protein
MNAMQLLLNKAFAGHKEIGSNYSLTIKKIMIQIKNSNSFFMTKS